MTELPFFTRREFITQGIGAGFALSVLPVTAWAITTSSEGILTDTLSIPTADGGKMPAYRAKPKGKGPFPVILVVHEIFGVHEYIQDVCRRLARQGYLAIAPDLYFREGDVTKAKDISEIRAKFVSKAVPTRVFKDLDATLDWLKASPEANLSKLGITGFCWGGTIVWTYSAHQPQVKAGVAWYGKLAAADQTHRPIDIATTLKTPVLGLYGGKDESIPLSDVEKMRAELKKGKSGSEIIVYPEAGHGFHADYRPSYHEKSAQDGWEKLSGWFKKYLK